MSNGIKWKPFLQLINIKIREDYGWIVIDYVGMCFVDYVNAKCKFWQGEALRVKFSIMVQINSDICYTEAWIMEMENQSIEIRETMQFLPPVPEFLCRIIWREMERVWLNCFCIFARPWLQWIKNRWYKRGSIHR